MIVCVKVVGSIWFRTSSFLQRASSFIPMIHIYFKTIRSRVFKPITQLRKGAWVYVDHATENDLNTIAKWSKLDLADIQDSLDIYEAPRLERIDGTILLFIRNPSNVHEQLYTEPVTILITKEQLITICPQGNPVIDQIFKIQTDVATTQQSKLLLFILLTIAKEFTRQIRAVSHTVYRQRRTMRQVNRKDITILIENEEILNQYLAALAPMETALATLLAGNLLKLYEEDQELLEDVLIEVRQSVGLCKVGLKSIVSLRDSYQILFTNYLNIQIKFLTSFTIILTLPTIIASLFGMNVPLPFSNHPLAFSFIVLGTITLIIVSFGFFAWKRWL